MQPEAQQQEAQPEQPQQQAAQPEQPEPPQQQEQAQPVEQAVQPEQPGQKPEQKPEPKPKATQEACDTAIANMAIQIEALQTVYDATPVSPIRTQLYARQKDLKVLVQRKKIPESNYKGQLKWRACHVGDKKKKRGHPPLEDHSPVSALHCWRRPMP